jgi:hypothetical protein
MILKVIMIAVKAYYDRVSMMRSRIAAAQAFKVAISGGTL